MYIILFIGGFVALVTLTIIFVVKFSGNVNLRPCTPVTFKDNILVPSSSTTSINVHNYTKTNILSFIQSDMVYGKGIKLKWMAMRMKM